MNMKRSQLTAEQKRALLNSGDAPKLFPLSSMQEKSWAYYKLDPESPMYNNPIGVKIAGKLNRENLSKALYKVVERHEALRIKIIETSKGPVQTLQKPDFFKLNDTSLSELSAEVKTQRFAEIKNSFFNKPFQIAGGHLFEALLIELAANENWLLIKSHQIVCDGISCFVIIEDLISIYKNLNSRSEEIVPLPENPKGYFEYVTKQLQWDRNKDSEYKSNLEYWEKVLADAPPRLEFPKDYSGKKNRQAQGFQSIQLPPDQYLKVKEYCQNKGLTPFMYVLGAFQLALAKWSQQTDVCIGTVTNSRSEFDEKAWKVVGEFTNPLVLRNQVELNQTVADHFLKVKETVLEAQTNSKCPFKFVVERLRPKRQIDQNPFFNISFVMHNIEEPELNFGNGVTGKVEVAPKLSGHKYFLFDMILQVHLQEGKLVFDCEYNQNKFDESSIKGVLNATLVMVFEGLKNSITSIADIELLTQEQQRGLVASTNDKFVAPIPDLFVHEMFQNQSAKTPKKTALVFENQELSYEELNSRSNQLAHHLVSCGVGPEVSVVLCLERSFEMIIAILAVLKAGGAYVPLDTDFPAERCDYIIQDTEAKIILTEAKYLSKFSTSEKIPTISLDKDWKQKISQYPVDNLKTMLDPQNPIYILYTSGSTGKPKGCINIHQALSNYVHWGKQRYQFDENCSVLVKTSYTFDVSFPEIIMPLISGGKLVICLHDQHKNPKYIAEKILSEKVTAAIFVPSMLNVLLEEGVFAKCDSLKTIGVSGEALPLSSVDRFFELLPNCRLINEYGPTEAAVNVSWWVCEKDDQYPSVPIGYPTANAKLYILDAKKRVVPMGMLGELYIGGVQVSRGYLKRSDLNEEKFVRDPFADQPNAKMYRTGDICRFLPNGAVEYLGRSDSQVKIRGFRIELGEIESVILENKEITEAAVLAMKLHGENAPLSLVAFFASEKQNVDENQIKIEAAKKLPKYMVPTVIVRQEKLPRISSGKIDRSSLAKFKVNATQDHRTLIKPRYPVEEKVYQIFQNILGSNDISIDDNFFDLGGHSLMAAQLSNRIKKEFSSELSLAEIFSNPSIESLSKHLSSSTQGQTQRVVLLKKGQGVPLFLIHALDGTLFPYTTLVNEIKMDIPIYGVPAQSGTRSKSGNFKTISEMASEIIERLKSVQPEGPYRIAGWSFGGIVAYEIATQLQSNGQHVDYLGLIDSYPGTLNKNKSLRELYDAKIHTKNGSMEDISSAFASSLQEYYCEFPFFANEITKLSTELVSTHPEMVEAILDRHEAMHKYQFQKLKIDCAHLIKCSEGDLIQSNSWNKYLDTNLKVDKVSGNHFSVLKNPHVRNLSEAIEFYFEGLLKVKWKI